MTIKDLARLSGYSLGTVSRVLNNQPNVSDKARAAILAIAEESGFELNESAQLLKQQRSNAVLIIVKGTANEMFASMVEHYIGSYEMNAPYLGGCALHDPLAVAVAIDPTLVGALGCNLRVDLLGEYRGRTICDEHRLSDPDKSALVALTVDAPRFLTEFKTRMARILG